MSQDATVGRYRSLQRKALMYSPSASKPIFWKRQAVLDSYRARKPSDQIYRTQIKPTQPAPELVCDRCADEEAPIAGVIIMPEAGEAQFFCDRCFERTPMLRRMHPEWRFFDVAGPLDVEELASALESHGLLE